MVQVGQSEIKKVTKIIHLADIHIRLYKRHQEYRTVFDNLYKSILEWKTANPDELACIVITGDLVHAKTDMSPEMVAMLSDLLLRLANFGYQVFVIPGNHDLNLANPHRLDSLTPVIDNIDDPNITYFKKSGIYRHHNVEFYVFSILDSPEEWPTLNSKFQIPATVDGTVEPSVKIGLFHGPVYSAKTDIGYTITSRNVEVEMFNGLDIVLLGDIHRYQVLNFYNPVIVYPGSLIQQNFGESLERHGWVEWDIESRTHAFHEIENDYGYVTVKVVGDSEFELPRKLPKNVRLRLFTEHLDSVGVKKVLSLIRKECNVIEVSVNKLGSTLGQGQNNSISTMDIHDVSYQNKLVQDYLEQNYPEISPEVLERVFDINKRLNSQIREEELPRNVHWKPIYLKFDNLFSYGTDNYVNFENMHGLYGVFSPNATGKTSAFDALCFALYDKTPRAFKGSHIMNTRENDCFCEFVFEVGSAQYKIVRKGSRRTNGEVKVDVEFYVSDGGSWKNLSGEDRRDTNAIIRSYVGDYDDFVLTNLSVQNNNALFIDKGQSERKDVLNQFMGLTVFDRLYDIASEESKEVAGTLRRFNKDDFTANLVTLQGEIETLTKDHNEWTEKVEYYRKKQDEVNGEIRELSLKKIPIKNVGDIKDLRIKKDKLQNDLRQKANDIVIYEKIKESEKSNLLGLSYDVPAMEKLIEDASEVVSKTKKTLQELSNKISVDEIRLAEYKKKVDWLSTYEYNPDCYYCVNNVFYKDAKEATRLMDELLPVLERSKTEKNVLEISIEAMSKTRRDIMNQHMERVTLDRSAKDAIEKAQHGIEKCQLQIQALQKDLDGCLADIDTYEKNVEAIQSNRKLDEELNRKLSILESFNEELKKAERRGTAVYGELEVRKSKKDDLMAKIREAEELESEYEAFEYYQLATSRNGVPYSIISQIIPDLQTSVNSILSQVVEFNVVLEVDGKNINGNIVYDETRKWPLELASGMEKFVTGLAIRVALMSVSSLPRSNFLIIDEGLGVLDSENLGSMFMLFNMLKNEFEFIILISHLDVVRDVADTLIEIRRDNGYSYLSVD